VFVGYVSAALQACNGQMILSSKQPQSQGPHACRVGAEVSAGREDDPVLRSARIGSGEVWCGTHAHLCDVDGVVTCAAQCSCETSQEVLVDQELHAG
jgi:hypothetical protein